MLNRNFAIALAVAMVMAALYGCSSSGGIKTDRDMYKELAGELQDKLDALDANGDGVADAAAALDADGDGIADAFEALDADGDGVVDAQAAVDALDANGDGIADAFAAVDADGDGVVDSQAALDALDADGDGVVDSQAELDALDANGDGIADAFAAADADGDGVVDAQAALDALDANGDGVVDAQAALDALDANGDGVADAAAALDADGNGIADAFEALDADGDGVVDAQAAVDALDANGDGIADAFAAVDADGDGVVDSQAALDALDADGDGVVDSQAKLDALDANGDGIADAFAAADADGDGVVDAQAALDALDADGDGVVDSQAALDLLDADGDGVADAAAALDADGDGVADPPMVADLKTQYLLEQAVVAGINEADDTNRPMVADGDVTVDYALKVSARDLEAAEDGAPDAGVDWSVQAMLTKSDGDATDKAFVYSNRMAPGKAAWNEYYDEADRASDGAALAGMTAVQSSRGLNADGNDASGDDTVTYRLTFAGAVAADAALFMAAGLPSGDRQTWAYSDDPNDDDDTDDDNRKFDGSYHGVMGEYECTAADCTAATNKDGDLITLTGTWTFTPAEVADGDDPHMVEGVDPDESYVIFGYWLRQVVLPEDGGETVGVNTFVGGDAPMDVADAGNIVCTGVDTPCSASYSGKAGGKYVVKTVTPRAEVSTLYTGQFVADVTLNATFGGEHIAQADKDEIKGSITGFDDAADDKDRIAHWTVKLGTAVTNSEAVDVDRAANVGMTNDGEMGGTWTHAFYSAQAENDETIPEEATMPPGAVAGEFDAHWTDGHAIGAYGATRD